MERTPLADFACSIARTLDIVGEWWSLLVLRDLFLGIALGEPQAFPYVELPGGKSAHVHLIPDGDGFHLVLIQRGHEPILERYALEPAVIDDHGRDVGPGGARERRNVGAIRDHDGDRRRCERAPGLRIEQRLQVGPGS